MSGRAGCGWDLPWQWQAIGFVCGIDESRVFDGGDSASRGDYGSGFGDRAGLVDRVLLAGVTA